MTLTFTASPGADPAVVRLAGSIDRDSGSRMEAIRTSADGASVLELDFSDVDYINSSGIALIVGLLTRTRATGTTVRAVGLSPHYRHIFEITRLSDFLEIVQPADALGGDRGHH